MKQNCKLAVSPARRILLQHISTGILVLLAGCRVTDGGRGPRVTPPPTPPQPLRSFPATLTADVTASVTRRGQLVPYSAGMQLYVGDQISTSSNAVVVSIYGDEVFIRPGTQIEIGSIFVAFGEVFARIFSPQGRDLFRVESTLVSAGPEGTEYLVRVARDGATQVLVKQGAVRCTPRRGGWAPMRVTPGQQFSVDLRGLPAVMVPPPNVFEPQFNWVRNATVRFRRQPLEQAPVIR